MAAGAWHSPKKARDRNMIRNSWRRTAFASIAGSVEIARDDRTLLDPSTFSGVGASGNPGAVQIAAALILSSKDEP
jgi:hypothetical protein